MLKYQSDCLNDRIIISWIESLFHDYTLGKNKGLNDRIIISWIES